MSSPMTSSLHALLTLNDLESQGHSDVKDISPIGAELGHMLLLAINRKPYMASSITSSLLTLSDIERSNSRSPRFFEALYLAKEPS